MDSPSPRGRVVVTYGTFDLFHVGHVRLLERAKSLGETLCVGLSTDGFNALKGKASFFPYEERKLILEACRYVDHVFAEECWEQKREDVVRLGADTFVMGDDWVGRFDFLSDLCDVVYLPRTPEISSTMIRRSCGPQGAERLTRERQARVVGL